jgi:hypothetical protein
MLVSDPDVSSLWLAGLSGSELEGGDSYRFRLLLQEQQFLLNTAFDRYVEHGMRERADAMAGILASLLERYPSVPAPIWLPGTEDFRDEVQKQRSSMQVSED